VFNLNGQVALYNTTMARNTAYGGVGDTPGQADGTDIYSLAYSDKAGTPTASVNLYNSILANPIGGSFNLIGRAVAGTSSLTFQTRNLVTDYALLTGTSTGPLPITADPLLGALQDNGGPSPTLALLPNSSAIGAGDVTVCTGNLVSSVDQRGLPRATCDLGAFQTQPPPPVPDMTAPPSGNDAGDPTRATGGGFTCSESRAPSGSGLLQLAALLLGIGALLGRGTLRHRRGKA
jgi:hypothetical protein